MFEADPALLAKTRLLASDTEIHEQILAMMQIQPVKSGDSEHEVDVINANEF